MERRRLLLRWFGGTFTGRMDPEGTVNLENVLTIAPRLEGKEEMLSLALFRMNDFAGLYESAEPLGRQEFTCQSE